MTKSAISKFLVKGSGLAVIAGIFLSCKSGAFNKSSVADAATADRFRSGFPQPKLRSEYTVLGKTAPLSVRQFTDLARSITGKTLVLSTAPGVAYSVVSTSEGEQILLLMSGDDLSTPVASINMNTLYSFGMHVSIRGQETLANELFVKSQFGAAQSPLEPQNMYVRRIVKTSSSTSEAVLVPWLNHVRSEVGSSIVFRVGNTIVDARSGNPVMEFRALNENSWIVIGAYSDADVEAGTLFWRNPDDDKTFYSLTPGRQTAVQWRQQSQVGDKNDSIDRIGVVSLSSARVPPAIAQYVETAPLPNAPEHPKNLRPLGFNWFEGDAGVIQLNRNSRVFLEPTTVAGALVGAGTTRWSQGPGASLAMDAISGPSSSVSLWWGSSQNKPVAVVGDSGVGYRGAVWTDESGVQRAGAILAERSVWQSGGVFSEGTYEKRFYVKNRSTDSYTEVRADGTSVRTDISDDAFRSMMRTSVNVERMQNLGGSLDRQEAEAAQLGVRADRQLERSMSLRPGGTVAAMASNMAVDNGINIAQWTLASGKPAGSQAAVILGANGLQEGVNVLRDPNGRSYEEAIVSLGERTLVDSAIAGSMAAGRATGSVGVSQLGVGTATTLDAYNTRAREGDFDPSKNPDYFYDSRVSGAAVAGRTVSGTASYLLVKDMPQGSMRSATAATARAVLNDGLQNTTEALSRASYSETLAKQRGEILEDNAQVNRDSEAARSALDTLDRIGPK